ncbi:MAG: DNA cytosine methyltransferase, partial [Dehalococcoidia bacterium]|nr:DNA cytosine methyltransferase [Dehalococcoidia bacterium]
MEKPTLISLYSGCGGSALGFQNAGFEITYMNDNNADACYTLKENFEKPSANPDRQVVHRGNVKDVFQFGSADIIEGGFPCQGFSLAGPRKVDDKRNMLYQYLKRAITFANPKFFVAENVKGFVTIGENAKQSFFKKGKIANLGSVASAIVKELEATGAGYNVKYELLDAKDYGLPQDRQRIFIVGVRKDLEYEFEFPKPTHGPGLKPYVTMKDYGVKDIHSLET